MSTPSLRLRSVESAETSRHFRQPVGQILVEMGVLDSAQLLRVLDLHKQCRAPVARICIAEGFATEDQVMTAQALQWGAMRLTLEDDPPDDRLADLLPAEFCRDHAIVPWGKLGDMLLLATSRPERFDAAMDTLSDRPPKVLMALASEAAINSILTTRHRAAFAAQAETAVLPEESCRSLPSLTRSPLALVSTALAVCMVALALVFATNWLFAGLILWACFTLMVSLVMKLAAFWNSTYQRLPDTEPELRPQDRPVISLLVPLYQETNIAQALLRRLQRLDYPHALTDILLVLEENDDQTRAALDQARLPPWFRVIEVPDSVLKTKPRALNYALGFCRGSIVGIYDAEDAPEPDQLCRIAARFANAPADVACLQGQLDYYNPQSNWLARCFTIEYATWFRVMLPGFARMGWAIPLGGTTVFFRRSVLEELRGWDAHNVTEDADLGMRLAQYGYRTELVPTVTREEANNRFWPWIRQRSRWLKGYMITYAVHMRAPLRSFRQMGAWKFIGMQAIFLTALSQFLLAPLLWSFWLVPFGVAHPLGALLGAVAVPVLAGAFLVAMAVDLLIGLLACHRAGHLGLRAWVPTTLLYFPLATVAAYKGLWEILTRPFFWDKTSHGHSQPE